MKGLEQTRRDEAAMALHRDNGAAKGQQGHQTNPLDADTLEWCANSLRLHGDIMKKQLEHGEALVAHATCHAMADTIDRRAEYERKR